MNLPHEIEYDLRAAAVDTNAKRAASTAPPMRETHVEVRRRVLERAQDALKVAEEEVERATARYYELFPKRDVRSEALEQAAEALPTPETNWAIGDHALRSEKLQRERALDTQVGGGHYKKMKIQVVEFVDKNQIPYLEGNAIKYICRHAEKGGVQDIDKAIHYLQLLKELRYGTAE